MNFQDGLSKLGQCYLVIVHNLCYGLINASWPIPMHVFFEGRNDIINTCRDWTNSMEYRYFMALWKHVIYVLKIFENHTLMTFGLNVTKKGGCTFQSNTLAKHKSSRSWNLWDPQTESRPHDPFPLSNSVQDPICVHT